MKNINIIGNERIPKETILMFSDIQVNEEINDSKANKILKDLYDSNFFENVTVKFDLNTLTIIVEEFPIIENININGIKAEKFIESIRNNFIFKPRSSFNKYLLSDEENTIKFTLKNFGYYFAEVETFIEKLDNNMVNINYNIV